MPSPDVLDFAKLLAPIPGDQPAGTDLRTDPSPTSDYFAIKDARSAARAAERQMVLAEDEASSTPADWRPVQDKAIQTLATKTKDLEITAYLVEALVRRNGFAGLRDGFRLAREFVEQFWDGLYPLPDEDGLETRVAPLAGLNGDGAEGTLIVPIARVPITDSPTAGRLGCVHFQQATALSKITDTKLRDKKIAQGAISLDVFLKAVAETPPEFFVSLVQDLQQCQEEFTKLSTALDQKCGGLAPPASGIKTALGSCLDIVKDVGRSKLEAAKTPGAAAAAPAAAAGSTAGPAPNPAPAPDVIQNREDAFRQLLKVAEFFRTTEPHTVVSYSLEQVVRWGRMSLPELLSELIPEEASRKNLFKQVGIKPPEPAKEAKK